MQAVAFYRCASNNCSTSLRLGMEGCAPGRVTEIAAAADANRAAFAASLAVLARSEALRSARSASR